MLTLLGNYTSPPSQRGIILRVKYITLSGVLLFRSVLSSLRSDGRLSYGQLTIQTLQLLQLFSKSTLIIFRSFSWLLSSSSLQLATFSALALSQLLISLITVQPLSLFPQCLLYQLMRVPAYLQAFIIQISQVSSKYLQHNRLSLLISL